MSNEIVPFGKHKGKPLDALLDDREYLDWLLAQGWFQQRYGNLYQVVINNGQEPSETPEHNAMQIKFLDEEYRLKFAYVVFGDRVFAFGCADRARQWVEENSKTREWEFNNWAVRSKSLITAPLPVFEQDGIDVAFDIFIGIRLSCVPHYHGPWPWPNVDFDKSFNVEIKPSIGDDYPAVLRQIQRNKSKYLLIRAYNGVGATTEQFVQFFKTQGIQVIFESDVDAVQLPRFDREFTLE